MVWQSMYKYKLLFMQGFVSDMFFLENKLLN